MALAALPRSREKGTLAWPNGRREEATGPHHRPAPRRVALAAGHQQRGADGISSCQSSRRRRAGSAPWRKSVTPSGVSKSLAEKDRWQNLLDRDVGLRVFTFNSPWPSSVIRGDPVRITIHETSFRETCLGCVEEMAW
uniref:Uncharacterized protein n=2 Tax=Setaria italica TaxID=4555 RepID=K4AP63_SETIT